MRTDTTQHELLALAKKHGDNAAVRAILTSITEATVQAQMALDATATTTTYLRAAVNLDSGSRISYDNSGLIDSAGKAAAALSTIAALLITLACVLESLGEKISY